MYIEKQDKQNVTVVIGDRKARDLLDGLLAHPELGDEAATLAQQLQDAGIRPSPPTDHLRHEYAPPLMH